MYASTRMSPFGILLELRMTEAVVTTAATSRANLQSNLHQQETNALQCTIPRDFHNQQHHSTEEKKYHIPKICSPQAHLGSSIPVSNP